MTMKFNGVFCRVSVIFGFVVSAASLKVDDGLLKEMIENYNLRASGPRRVVDFKNIRTPMSTYPVSSDSRMNVTAVTGKGRRYETVFLLTELPASGFRRDLALKSGIFDTNFNVYTQVIPKLEELLLDSDDYSEPLWPTHLASRWRHIIITEIYPKGRWLRGSAQAISTAADYGLVLKSLAKWHAMTAVLLEKKLIPEEIFNVSVTVRNQQRTLNYYKYLLKNFAEVVRVSWGDQWAPLVAQINDLASSVSKRILDIFNDTKSSGSVFKVLNLGDINVDDLMFSYGISDTFESSHPIAMKFSSFDCAHVNSPALDVNSALYTLPSLGTALKNRDSLLTSSYYPALIRYLTQFGFAGSPPTLAQFRDELRRTELLAVLDSLRNFAHVKTSPDRSDLIDGIEKAWKTGEVNVNVTGMLTAEFSQAMKPLMVRVMDANVFGN